MKKLFALVVMLALLPTPSFAEIFGNPDNGQILFSQRCAACHSGYQNMTGSRL
jgi:cytochrome c2